MPNSFMDDFGRFVRERLNPVVETVGMRRRSGLLMALGVAAVAFALFAAGVYLAMRPYSAFMSEHGVPGWPLLFLAPLSLAAIVFSLVYILSLRGLLGGIRRELFERMAEFIEPGMICDASSPMTAAEVDRSLLFADRGKPVAVKERFRGRMGEAEVGFCGMRVVSDGKDGGGTALSGLLLKAGYGKRFKAPLFIFPAGIQVSRSGLEEALRGMGIDFQGELVRLDDRVTGRRVLKPSGAGEWGDGFLSRDIAVRLDALRAETGAEMYFSCRGGEAYIGLMTETRGAEEGTGGLEEFYFTRCREFCQEARLALALARELGDRPDLWR